MKRTLGILLALAMLFSLLPAAALAEEIRIVDTEDDLITIVDEGEAEQSPTAPDRSAYLERDGSVARRSPRHAADAAPAPASNESGSCGKNLTWTLDDSGTLTISGVGPMYEYDWENQAPWWPYYETIKALVVKSGVTTISPVAFDSCYYLQSASIPSTVKTIGWGAFWDSNLNLSNGVTKIESYAFTNCYALTSFTLPASVTELGSGVFRFCSSLTSITVGSGSESFASSGGVLFTKDMTMLHTYPGGKAGSTYTLPSTVEVIGAEAFSGIEKLSDIRLPQGLQSINSMAFYDCLGLTEVTIPAGISYIDSTAYMSCNNLKSITVAEGGAVYRSIDGVLFSAAVDSLIIYPAGRQGDYVIPDGVYQIYHSAFDGAYYLTGISFPEGLTTIYYDAFYDCSGLTELCFPESLAYIADHAFTWCGGLTSIRFLGPAPEISETAFQAVTAEVFYPAEEPSWTESMRQDYGGTLTWTPVSSAAPPVLSLAKSSTKGAALGWNAVEGAEQYELQRRTGSGWDNAAALGGCAWTDAKVKMNETYTYRIRARIGGAWTDWSGELSFTFNPFSDVSGKKTLEYVAWAYNKDIVKGTSETTFKPDAGCTRIQFVMMLWKMHGSPEVSGTNPFSDISGSKTTKAILWALDAGVINSSSKFDPDGNITRVQIVMILWKLAGSPNVTGENPFTDVSGSKTTKAVLWAYQRGITTGTSKTTFSPDKDCTRVQLVIFLYKYNLAYPVKDVKYRALLVGEVHFSWEQATRNQGDVENLTALLEEVEGPEGGKYEINAKLDLSRDGIRAAIQEAFAEADDDDVSLFFIATHGVTDIESGPYAGEILTIEVPGSWDGYLTLPDLASWLNAVPGKVIVLLGSCGSGAAILGNGAELTPEEAAEAQARFNEAVIRAFAEAEGDASNTGEFRTNKYYVLTAAAHMQSSWGYEPWGDGVGANYFPLAFMQGAMGSKPADTNKDGLITLNEMWLYCKEEAYGPYWDGTGYYYQDVQVWPENSSYPLFR